MININIIELNTLNNVCKSTTQISLKLNASNMNNAKLCSTNKSSEYTRNLLTPMLLSDGSSFSPMSFLLIIPFITKGRMNAINTHAAAFKPGVPANKSTAKPMKKPEKSSCQFGILNGNIKIYKT